MVGTSIINRFLAMASDIWTGDPWIICRTSVGWCWTKHAPGSCDPSWRFCGEDGMTMGWSSQKRAEVRWMTSKKRWTKDVLRMVWMIFSSDFQVLYHDLIYLGVVIWLFPLNSATPYYRARRIGGYTSKHALLRSSHYVIRPKGLQSRVFIISSPAEASIDDAGPAFTNAWRAIKQRPWWNMAVGKVVE